MKLFVTGDNHFGRKFDKYAVKNQLVESRFKCLEEMVKQAEAEKCEFFVVAGDLFDNTYAIAKKDVKRVVDTLGSFTQQVLVLPGNHDFYSGNEKLWEDFTDVADSYSNIIILNAYEPVELNSTDGQVVFYPAHCDMKHSETNRLEWIKQAEIDSSKFNIGIAHGALEGLACDTEGVYFPMSRNELQGISVDVWLLGHAHIAEPAIPANEEVSGYTIFNAGTHEQLDLHNNTEGNAFIITVEFKNDMKRVIAKRVITGAIRYYDETIEFKPTENMELETTIRDFVKDYPSKSIVRLTLKGSVSSADFEMKESIYDANLSRFMNYKIIDSDLSEKITIEKIENEFSEIGFAAKFLKNLINDPVELQMAYEVVNSLK
ncbi:DNA repair exonuclease SbcCD nuclease subunit [Lachnospiraceae bacterium XBB1006]|nr:DNA repair exonuclease SbcCD nuclease subunit [Lachnospiraceae bacterium XBB1006]